MSLEANKFYMFSYGIPQGNGDFSNLQVSTTLSYPNIATWSNNKTLLPGQTMWANFTSRENCIISCSNALANTTLRLRDVNGVTLISAIGTNSFSYSLLANNTYNFSFYNGTGASISSVSLFNCAVSNTSSVSQIFPNGFENKLATSSAVTLTYDAYGQPTYTFNNYNFTSGNLFLTQALFPASSTTVTVSVTGGLTAITNGYSDPVLPGASFLGMQLISTSGTYSGTVSYAVAGVGTAVQQNLAFVTVGGGTGAPALAESKEIVEKERAICTGMIESILKRDRADYMCDLIAQLLPTLKELLDPQQRVEKRKADVGSIEEQTPDKKQKNDSLFTSVKDLLMQAVSAPTTTTNEQPPVYAINSVQAAALARR